MPEPTLPEPTLPEPTIVGPTVGEPAPPIGGPSTVHQRLDLEQFAGKVPIAAVFLTGLADPDAAIAALDEAHIAFGHARVQLLGILDEPIGAIVERTDGRSVPIVADPDRRISNRYVIPSDAQHVTVVAIDMESTVVAISSFPNGPRLADSLAAMVVEA